MVTKNTTTKNEAYLPTLAKVYNFENLNVFTKQKEICLYINLNLHTKSQSHYYLYAFTKQKELYLNWQFTQILL